MLGMGRSAALEPSRRGRVIYVNGASADTQKCNGIMTFAGGGSANPLTILIDANAHFQTDAVAVGDKIESSAALSTIASVDSETQVTLDEAIMDDAIAGGSTNGAEAFKLIDSLATFESLGVEPGYIVVCVTDMTYATVVALDPVTPETKLTLSANNFTLGEGYNIYQPLDYTIYYKRTGASWSMSYLTVQNALEAVTSSIKEIWVAGATGAGQTYLPTALTTRTIYHVALAGVNVYGGFAGTEILRSQRNPDLNLTILSGNVGGTEGTNGSYHVVSTNEAALASPSVWDGFTIRGGVCNGSSTLSRGGGVSNRGGLILSNCKITACKGHGSYNGSQPSAIYGEGGTGLYNVAVTACTLGSETVYVTGALSQDGLTVSGCTCVNSAGSRIVKLATGPFVARNLVLSGNTPASSGNAYMLGFPTATNGTIINAVITDNVGGGIFAVGTGAGLVNLDHFTVTRNALVGTGGGIRQANAGDTSVVLNVTNSIIYGNTATVADNNMSYANALNLLATYSDCQGGFAGTGNIDTDPLFVAATDAIGPDLLWNTADDGLIPTAATCLASGSDGDNMGNYRRAL